MRKKREADPLAILEYNRRWRAANAEKVENQRLRSDFGIDLAEYRKMLAGQGSVCAICRGVNPSGKRLAVDHDHKTGKVRALLCGRCNTALGQMRDDPALCRKAAQYLEEWQHGR